jgi:hypothetical protein
MTKLLEKNEAFEWTTECQASFEELRKRITSAPVLVLPDLTKKFDIYYDASRQGLESRMEIWDITPSFCLPACHSFLILTSSHHKSTQLACIIV